jgi:hypothetical protein
MAVSLGVVDFFLTPSTVVLRGVRSHRSNAASFGAGRTLPT